MASRLQAVAIAAAVVLLLPAVSGGCGDNADVSATSSEPKASAPPLAQNGKIAFSRDPNIYVANADGGSLERLTSGRGGYPGPVYAQPAWASDGARLAFVRVTSPTHDYVDVLVAHYNGRKLARPKVVFKGGMVIGGHPAWSPDDTQLLFSAPDEQAITELLFLANLDGGSAAPLPIPAYDWLELASEMEDFQFPQDEEPTWSPDGRWICFSSYPDISASVGWKLYLVHPDGSGLKAVPETPGHNPDWSPDGEMLAFDHQGDIWVVEPDGSHRERLTETPTKESDPAWSPDGKQILFVRATGSDSADIWVMNAYGSGTARLIRNGFGPDWQPIPTR